MNKHIIDVTMEEFNDLPLSLDGEVLLERTLDNNGNVSGYLTISVDKIMTIKTKSDMEIEAIGWGKFKHILDTF
mgnify:CR=1 FL=1